MIRDIFGRFVDGLYDRVYDWACGAYKVNWLLVIYFGVSVPALLILTYYFVKGCVNGH
jgi:hypothetical protein